MSRFLLHLLFDALYSQWSSRSRALTSAQEHIDADRAGLKALSYRICAVVQFAGVEVCHVRLFVGFFAQAPGGTALALGAPLSLPCLLEHSPRRLCPDRYWRRECSHQSKHKLRALLACTAMLPSANYWTLACYFK